jgi:hypothetical protein
MRNGLRTLVVLASCAAFAACNAQSTILAKVTTDHKLTPLEAAAAIVIGDALGFKVDALVMSSKSYNESFVAIGPALMISQYTGHPLDHVLANKPKGEGWGNVAKKLGMHPGTFNKMRAKNGSFEDQCWMNMLYSKYKFPESEYLRVQKQGLSYLEIVLAVVKSEGKKEPLDKAVKEILAAKPKPAELAKGGGKAGGKGSGGGKGGGKGGG